ncbi:hypothetical protein LINGRAHAP2_LOCUS19917 [Linum grandiflorum]
MVKYYQLKQQRGAFSSDPFSSSSSRNEKEGETSALEGVFSMVAVNDEIAEADEEEDAQQQHLSVAA